MAMRSAAPQEKMKEMRSASPEMAMMAMSSAAPEMAMMAMSSAAPEIEMMSLEDSDDGASGMASEEEEEDECVSASAGANKELAMREGVQNKLKAEASIAKPAQASVVKADKPDFRAFIGCFTSAGAWSGLSRNKIEACIEGDSFEDQAVR